MQACCLSNELRKTRVINKMKFRSLATKFEAIQNIWKSLLAASRLSPSIIFCIDPLGIKLIADPGISIGPSLIRCKLLKSLLFDEYVFNGLSAQHNQIYLELNSDSLYQLLVTLQSNMKFLKFKLMNGENGRFLLGIIAGYPTFSDDRIISHQIHVELIRQNHWHTLDEPELDPVQISLLLPSIKQIGTLINKLSTSGQFAVISAKLDSPYKGYFSIGICKENLMVVFKSSNLDVDPEFNHSDDDTLTRKFQVRIDIQRLSQVFSSLSFMKPKIICQISNKNYVCFQFFNDLANFKVVLPNFDV